MAIEQASKIAWAGKVEGDPECTRPILGVLECPKPFTISVGLLVVEHWNSCHPYKRH